MNKFLERLSTGEILVADGATGSNLQKMGLKPGRPPEDLIIDSPDIILKLAGSFVEAGSDIILTCTFGGTRMRMKDSKYQDRTPEVYILAAEIARQAASARDGVLVAGSMGHVGALIKPYGPLEAEDVKATFAEQAKALAEGGVDPAEPLTNYAVVQAKREWSNQSSLGFMVTNTARRITPDVDYLPSIATTGGVTWDWRLKDPRYAVTGYWSGSTVRGNTEAIDALQQSPVHYFQRPDAEHLEYDPASTSMSGHAGMMGFQKVGGQKVRFSFVGSYKTPGFDVNDVGYMRRADAIQQWGWVQFRWDAPTKLYRSFRRNLNQWAGWNFGGDSDIFAALLGLLVV